MELSVKERVLLLGTVIPKEGDFITLKIVRKLQESVSFSEEETKYYNFKQNGGNVSWEHDDQSKDIEIGEKAHDIIADGLKKLDREKKLTMEHMSLFEKFVNAK